MRAAALALIFTFASVDAQNRQKRQFLYGGWPQTFPAAGKAVLTATAVPLIQQQIVQQPCNTTVPNTWTFSRPIQGAQLHQSVTVEQTQKPTLLVHQAQSVVPAVPPQHQFYQSSFPALTQYNQLFPTVRYLQPQTVALATPQPQYIAAEPAVSTLTYSPPLPAPQSFISLPPPPQPLAPIPPQQPYYFPSFPSYPSFPSFPTFPLAPPSTPLVPSTVIPSTTYPPSSVPPTSIPSTPIPTTPRPSTTPPTPRGVRPPGDGGVNKYDEVPSTPSQPGYDSEVSKNPPGTYDETPASPSAQSTYDADSETPKNPAPQQPYDEAVTSESDSSYGSSTPTSATEDKKDAGYDSETPTEAPYSTANVESTKDESYAPAPSGGSTYDTADQVKPEPKSKYDIAPGSPQSYETTSAPASKYDDTPSEGVDNYGGEKTSEQPSEAVSKPSEQANYGEEKPAEPSEAVAKPSEQAANYGEEAASGYQMSQSGYEYDPSATPPPEYTAAGVEKEGSTAAYDADFFTTTPHTTKKRPEQGKKGLKQKAGAPGTKPKKSHRSAKSPRAEQRGDGYVVYTHTYEDYLRKTGKKNSRNH